MTSMISLYSHQRKAVDKLRSGSILVGGVGSGKSRTALAFFAEMCGCNLNSDNPSLLKPMNLYIITTARKRDTYEWDDECSIFPFSNIDVKIDSWNNIGKFENVQNHFFIFDEQRVVGSGSWSKAFIKIARQNKWILLSATPGDTWMDYVPVFLANNFYKNRTEFVRQHVVYSRFSKYPKVDRYIETSKLERLRDSITVNMPFAKPATQNHVDVLVNYENDLYTRVFKDRWNIYEKRPIKDASEFCMTLRKIVNSSNDRLSKLYEIITKHPRVIVFYNFDYELELLRNLLDFAGVLYSEWNGHKHMPIPTSSSWVYLVQYTAGAEGWNCIDTNVIVFYSQNYSYKITTQAAGRIDRLNTKYENLYYYHLVSDSSIDKSISKALKRKENFNEKLFAS